MSPEERNSMIAIALHAAFADGSKHDHERDEIRRIAESLAGDSGATDLGSLYQDVLLKRVTLESHVAALTDPGQRQLAYEMAVCVCDADGRQTEAERRFLADLKDRLRLDGQQASAFDAQADAIVDLSESAAPAAGTAQAREPVTVMHAAVPAAELDRSILNYALVNGALELLPQSWASMAIIPLQIRMVYGIGKAYGVTLDQGHIREFIAAAGVGFASQYLEQFGRKLLGGLFGKMAGRTVGKVGGAATGMAFSFATTYALGQVARRYYAGGRVMTTAMVRDTFQSLLEPAKQLQTEYLPQIRRQADTLDMNRIMAMVRGG